MYYQNIFTYYMEIMYKSHFIDGIHLSLFINKNLEYEINS